MSSKQGLIIYLKQRDVNNNNDDNDLITTIIKLIKFNFSVIIYYH